MNNLKTLEQFQKQTEATSRNVKQPNTIRTVLKNEHSLKNSKTTQAGLEQPQTFFVKITNLKIKKTTKSQPKTNWNNGNDWKTLKHSQDLEEPKQK